ncbi:hypothetical protein HH214_04935 [Mucilaginibacter robiniae]|uniref:DUF4249 family protein n=1 Tax=Mucilaginibacter robiniae TaxID=2728022 RepID=A0A7L5E4K4_9SPHI|nr:DUF4249 family protein [Mucilaginibacter robiniae]QJD95266.1 hypothetical protein HH214_04935 [Mucilaginibacter robiniae]
MSKYIHFFIGLMALAVMASCKKESTSTVANEPVVVGYLLPGQPVSIKVYQQKGLTDTATFGALISGLKLTVSDGSKTVQLTETATGTYTYSDLSFLVAGKTYSLQFAYNGANVSASTLMPAKPTGYKASRTSANIPTTNSVSYNSDIAVTYTWNNPDSLYHVLVFKNDDPSPYNINLRANDLVNFTLNAERNASFNLYYRTLNYIGTYRVILYSVNKEYINALSSNANSSSQSLTNPPTNITNGFGIFTAMQSDTVALTLTQY